MLRVRSVSVSVLFCCSHFANNPFETERFAMSPAHRSETERFPKLPNCSHYQYSCIRFQAASARTGDGNGGGDLIGKGPTLSTGGGGAPSGQALSGTSIRSSGLGVEPERATGARYG